MSNFLYSMKLPKKSYSQIIEALEYWKNKKMLDKDKFSELKASIQPIVFDFSKLAKYSFWIAIACFITSVSAMFMDRILMELLYKIFNSPVVVKFIFMLFMASFFYYLGFIKRQKFPQHVFRNEVIFFIGVLFTAAAIYFLGRLITENKEYFSNVLLLGCIIYAVLGVALNSKLIWLFALLSLGSWFGCETGYLSGWGSYYLGMNYPLRFVLFAVVLIFLSFCQQKHKNFLELHRTTFAMGLLYLFIALWILSIFGNYGDMHNWSKIKQIELFHWSLLFFTASVATIYHGIRNDDHMTRSFGIVFLFINIYTRYFELFWNGIHKSLFFAVLGGSLWYIGSKAEQFSLISKLKKHETRKKS